MWMAKNRTTQSIARMIATASNISYLLSSAGWPDEFPALAVP
jgi:hypothetical protein